ncbi:hypothetical protein Aeqsu_3084 [Aequorivita sublithincola DSM 14238]|uniref:Uncharacterized protein n=2 Tax=Aequorivita TaxID=153265 RepID=I3YZV3_AEQSU|nr:hypothetical protein Aeqsu_3084 [Aequorivita sublithincola DSM 14238]
MRKKWLLPIAVFAIAIASAFASNVKTTESLAPMGYIDSPTACQIAVPCSRTFGEVCKKFSQQAFGLDHNGTSCTVELYKP